MPQHIATETRTVPQAIVTELFNLSGRADAVRTLRLRYDGATKAQKGRLLDELVYLTGWHRKHVIRLLGTRARRAPVPFYDGAVREALAKVWEASGRVCGKRLKTLLPGLVGTLVREGKLARDPLLRGKLLGVSAATIDRLLRPVRARRAVVSFEDHLKDVSQAISELAHLTIPADLAPEERRRLEAQRQLLAEEIRLITAERG